MTCIPGWYNWNWGIVGWSSTVDGVYIRSTSDVRWMWAVIYRPEETEREIHCEDASEIRVWFAGWVCNWVVILCLSHYISACATFLCWRYDLVILIMMKANQPHAAVTLSYFHLFKNLNSPKLHAEGWNIFKLITICEHGNWKLSLEDLNNPKWDTWFLVRPGPKTSRPAWLL